MFSFLMSLAGVQPSFKKKNSPVFSYVTCPHLWRLNFCRAARNTKIVYNFIFIRSGRPDVPVRVRRNIVQVRSESPNNQAIVAIPTDEGEFSCPYILSCKLAIFFIIQRKIFHAFGNIAGECFPRSPFYVKGGLQERDAPTVQYEDDATLCRFEAKAPTIKPS